MQFLDQKEIRLLRSISYTNCHGLLPWWRVVHATESEEATLVSRSIVLRSDNSSGPG